MRLAILCLLLSTVLPSTVRAQVPVFEVTKADSTVKFNVSASVTIAGTFDKWDATLTFTSPDARNSGFGHQDSGGQREYRKRHEGQQAEGQRLLRC